MCVCVLIDFVFIVCEFVRFVYIDLTFVYGVLLLFVLFVYGFVWNCMIVYDLCALFLHFCISCFAIVINVLWFCLMCVYCSYDLYMCYYWLSTIVYVCVWFVYIVLTTLNVFLLVVYWFSMFLYDLCKCFWRVCALSYWCCIDFHISFLCLIDFLRLCMCSYWCCIDFWKEFALFLKTFTMLYVLFFWYCYWLCLLVYDLCISSLGLDNFSFWFCFDCVRFFIDFEYFLQLCTRSYWLC